MKGSRALIFSLGLASLTLPGCEEPRPAKRLEARRPVEPRLSTGSPYAPCRLDRDAPDLVPDAVCAQPSPEAEPEARAARDATVRGREERSLSPAALQERGLWHLGSGELRKVDLAVRNLELAAAGEPGNARIRSDLSAAYLVRAQRRDDPRDLLRALTAANQAVRQDGSPDEARFNRAVALERLFLETPARRAWKSYRDFDPDSPWAAEASDRLAALDRPVARSAWDDAQRERLDRAALAGKLEEVAAIVRRFRQETREYAELQLLGEWADAAGRGETDLAARRLGVARAIGRALVRVNGERLAHDAVAAIDEASGAAPGRLRSLIQGHRDFREGYALYKERKSPPAGARLAASREALARARSPFALRAAFYLACRDYLEHLYDQSFRGLERLARDLTGRPYPGLLGHTLWMQALCRATDGRLAQAVESYEKSLAVYRGIGESENVAAVESLLGQSLLVLGHGREAWEHAYRGLRNASGVRNAGLRSMIFMIAADAALREGALETALAFQREAVRHAAESSPLRQVETLTWLGWMEANAGHRERALRVLKEAGEKIDQLENPGQRRRRAADISGVEGSLVLREEPQRAVSLLTSALAVYQEEKNTVFALRTLLARARAERLAGDDVRAEEDVAAGLETFERLGASLVSEDLRLAFLEETGEVFDEMISLQAGRDPYLAFAYADRARTRVLPGSVSKLWMDDPAGEDRLLAAEPRPLPLAEIRRRLPKDVSLVQFSVLPDRVLIWRIRPDGTGEGFFERRIRREDLEDRIARLRLFDRLETVDWEPLSGELFELLVRPWLAGVGKDERLVFVPDKALHLLPFAVLRDPATGRFLIEDHTIVVAPSATLYVNTLEGQRRGVWSSLSRGLVVGDPEIDRERFGDLLPLPGAAAEAARLAERSGAVLLTGKEAGKSAFLSEAAGAEWIHLASHAVVDPRNPLLSHLVLAPDGSGDPGALTAREIYPLDLDGTRLVVLAGCDTGREYVPGSEGATSLARAFHAAGVPTVVASLSKVDDRSAAKLFDVFYSNLLAGEDPASSLRKAQLALLASRDETDRSPAAWGVFEVIGASAH